jgi:hypothetical protein
MFHILKPAQFIHPYWRREARRAHLGFIPGYSSEQAIILVDISLNK